MTAGTAIHFGFPDRAIGYRCATCDQRCCTGGMDFHAARDRRILDERPELRPFVRRAHAPQLRVLEMAKPRCYFALGATGGCALHRDHGHAAKPAMCRLYPANLVTSVPGHDALIIGLQFAVCPLTVTDDPAATRLEHRALRAQIAEAIASGEVAPAEAPPHVREFPRWFLALEDAITGRFDRGDGVHDQLAWQLAVMNAEHPLAHRPTAAELADARATIDAHVDEIAELLGVARAPLDADTARSFAAVTPALRMRYLLDPRALDYRERMTRIPYALATLALLAALQGPRLRLAAFHELYRTSGALAMLTSYAGDQASAAAGYERVERPRELADQLHALANRTAGGLHLAPLPLRDRIREVALDDRSTLLRSFARELDALAFAPPV